MEIENNLMSQLIFKFPFKTQYFKQDFYVSSNNFSAYKLIESWPNWSSKWVNVYGVSGSGKTHLSKILEKNKKILIVESKIISSDIIDNLKDIDCLIIDNFVNDIDEKIFYSLLNESKQLEKFILINSKKPIRDFTQKLSDLKSRLDSFLFIGIDLPTDDLLQVIITKSFSDKQVNLDPKITSFIIKNVDRSYDKMSKFLREIDEFSLSSGKSININLIKKCLKFNNE